jgi:hypothetical protein
VLKGLTPKKLEASCCAAFESAFEALPPPGLLVELAPVLAPAGGAAGVAVLPPGGLAGGIVELVTGLTAGPGTMDMFALEPLAGVLNVTNFDLYFVRA